MKYILPFSRTIGAVSLLLSLGLGTAKAQMVATAGALTAVSAVPDEPAPMFRVNVAMVNLNITVTDSGGHPVRGLDQKDFAIFEEGVPQTISSFHEDSETPVSVGVLFDVSQSMSDKIARVRQAVDNFCDTINPRDEVFLIRFNSSVKLMRDYTDDRKKLKKAVGGLNPKGETALYDAIIEGLQHLRSSKYDKKALLVITDGQDTKSHAKLRDVVEAAHRSSALVYGMAIGGGKVNQNGIDDTVDFGTLKAIAAASGAKAFLIESKKNRDGKDAINAAALSVSAELRDQYTLAYYPPPAKRDGEFRRIKVSNYNPDFAVRARTGYLTSKQQQ